MFETFIIQPIFNFLLFIYSHVPGNDFGVAIILFTIAIRFLMWPMLKKQFHNTRKMNALRPKIKEIKKKAKGDRQKEGQLLMELYREEGISPFSSFGLLLVQLPVFIGLFAALNSLLESPIRIIELPYTFIRDNAAVQGIIQGVADKTNAVVSGLSDPALQQSVLDKFGGSITADSLQAMPDDQLEQVFNVDLAGAVTGPFFDQHLGSFIDLTRTAIENGAIYWPLMFVAIFAGVLQFIQTKQLAPRDDVGKKNKSIREILKESAEGKEPDQSEINAAVMSKTTFLFGPLIWWISAISPGGLALYFATSGLVGYIQQRFVLNRDVDEMEEIADESDKSDKPKSKNNKKNNSNKNKSANSKKKPGSKNKNSSKRGK